MKAPAVVLIVSFLIYAVLLYAQQRYYQKLLAQAIAEARKVIELARTTRQEQSDLLAKAMQDQLQLALNLGCELDCSGCMTLAFTGYVGPNAKHTCKKGSQ